MALNGRPAKMKTTLNLDDDLLTLVKQYAKRRSITLGQAVSELVRRGIDARPTTRIVNGLQVVDLLPSSPKVTSKKIRDLDAEQG